jgi:hypothetical protein
MRIARVERFKDEVTSVLGIVPRATIDLWSIFRDDALALSYLFDELDGDLAVLDVGTFVGVSAMLFAVQPRVRHVTSIDPNPLVADELSETGAAVGLPPVEGGAVAGSTRVQEVAARALSRFDSERAKIALVEGTTDDVGTTAKIPDPRSVGADRLVAFVDGLHSAAAVEADLSAIFEANRDALVILDDCRYYWGPFVQAGVAHFLERTGDEFAFRLVADTGLSLATCTLGLVYRRANGAATEAALERTAERVSRDQGALHLMGHGRTVDVLSRLERERDDARADAVRLRMLLAESRTSRKRRLVNHARRAWRRLR